MDLSTNYLGLKLRHPIVPSAGPLSRSLDSMKQLEDAGAAAIVMYSLFEEQFSHEAAELDHYLNSGTESFAESLSYFPGSQEFNLEPDDYVELLRSAKKSLGIPVIASLNGVTPGGWVSYGARLQDAGADAIELNAYYIPSDPLVSGPDIENRYVEILQTLRSHLKIPLAIKLGPFFSSLPHFARRLRAEGADGLVLFNRFYQPDIDIEERDVVPGVTLSTSSSNRLPMRWIAILRPVFDGSIAATTGIHTAEDVIKMIMAGADVTMMCSALLKNGPSHIASVLHDLEKWLTDHEYESIAQMKGSMSHRNVANPSAFERANYMKALNSFPI
jgi:dihydroorotate dehydrogenase (fumarate)